MTATTMIRMAARTIIEYSTCVESPPVPLADWVLLEVEVEVLEIGENTSMPELVVGPVQIVT